MNVNEIIRQTIDNAKKNEKKGADQWYLAPDIPAKKINGACSTYARIEPGMIVALYDSTLFGSAKEGIVLTGAKMYAKNGKNEFILDLENISSIVKKFKVKQKDGKNVNEYHGIRISSKDEKFYDIDGILFTMDYSIIEEIVTQLTTEDKKIFEEVNAAIPLENENFDVKKSYIEIMAAIAFDDDGRLDSRELAEILKLMTRIAISAEERYDIREYINNPINKMSIDESIAKIKNTVPMARFSNIRISIMKDAINLYRAQALGENTSKLEFGYSAYSSGGYSNSEILQGLKDKLEITPSELAIIEQSIINDIKIMTDRKFTDDLFKKAFAEMASKAGAIGMPLAAVYLTGTLGVSAVGLTSGLAALGMGGVLGFSSMLTGIGVAVLIGVISYKAIGIGIKKITGDSNLEHFRQREFFLKEAVKMTQKTINTVAEDINHITKQLKDAVFSSSIEKEEQNIKIESLMKTLDSYSGATTELLRERDYAEKEELLIKVPSPIDINRLKSLTNEPSRAEFFEPVFSMYTNKNIVLKDGSSDVSYVLKDGLSGDDLGDIYKLLTELGYFDFSNIVQQKAMDTGKAILNKLSGPF